jgi:hypothetical protein
VKVEVVEKVRVDSRNILDRFNEHLWQLTRHVLVQFARFDEHGYNFMLHSNPFPGEKIHPGQYRMGKVVDDANTYRVGHGPDFGELQNQRSKVQPPIRILTRLAVQRKRMHDGCLLETDLTRALAGFSKALRNPQRVWRAVCAHGIFDDKTIGYLFSPSIGSKTATKSL